MYFQPRNQVYKFRSNQEICASSFYIFTLPFFTFSKESFILFGNTRRIFTKLFEELVSHYFSYLIKF